MEAEEGVHCNQHMSQPIQATKGSIDCQAFGGEPHKLGNQPNNGVNYSRSGSDTPFTGRGG